jgi:hypothetical protein
LAIIESAWERIRGRNDLAGASTKQVAGEEKATSSMKKDKDKNPATKGSEDVRADVFIDDYGNKKSRRTWSGATA